MTTTNLDSSGAWRTDYVIQVNDRVGDSFFGKKLNSGDVRPLSRQEKQQVISELSTVITVINEIKKDSSPIEATASSSLLEKIKNTCFSDGCIDTNHVGNKFLFNLDDVCNFLKNSKNKEVSQKVNVYVGSIKEKNHFQVTISNKEKRMQDKFTGSLYLKEKKSTIIFKCFLLSLFTIPAHALDIIYRIGKLITLSFLWTKKPKGQHCKSRLQDAKSDLWCIIKQPVAIIALELSAIYGMIRPFDGRKLYGSWIRWLYGNESAGIAPCFQPIEIGEDEKHGLGGIPLLLTGDRI